ncbi:MAG TPA: GNAT family N-acetyltransferase [Dehalococcoidia bacterium]|nr:GNAT family N-acetyltransferase [Dehalococcoidia bacterium]
MAIVRPATEQDIPRILELYNELTEERHALSPEETRSAFAQITAMPGHELLVAEEEGVVVGTMVMLVVPNLSHGALPWAMVENMIVDKKYRRRGIGRLLMEYVIARARKAGCYKVQFLSNKKRRQAHKFYRSLGFEASAHGFRLYL